MASYTTIADVGNTLVKILQSSLVPDVIQNNNLIGLCEPFDKGDFVLGIYLYNIEQNQDMRMNSYISNGVDTQIAPPIFLNLYYMITAYSQSDVKFKSAENQIILGKTIQTFNDCSFIQDNIGNSLRVDMINPSYNDKKSIWNNFNQQKEKLSLFYRVSPVEISSNNSRKIVRITDVDFSSKEYTS